jgi:hypothetical protein
MRQDTYVSVGVTSQIHKDQRGRFCLCSFSGQLQVLVSTGSIKRSESSVAMDNIHEA